MDNIDDMIRVREYKEFIREDFLNPFDNIETEKKKKPVHISDKGGFMKLRKPAFNQNRIECTKRTGGKYIITSRTQFSRGETVEICPVLFLGSEARAVDNLKDVIFELDKGKDQWGLVLGYGSLYGHAEDPNLDYAFNKKTKQMHFISKKTIQMGEELSINYGKDYWDSRRPVDTEAEVSGSAAKSETDEIEESEVSPNAADRQEKTASKVLADPHNRANPARSGVAIKGMGQQ